MLPSEEVFSDYIVLSSLVPRLMWIKGLCMGTRVPRELILQPLLCLKALPWNCNAASMLTALLCTLLVPDRALVSANTTTPSSILPTLSCMNSILHLLWVTWSITAKNGSKFSVEEIVFHFPCLFSSNEDNNKKKSLIVPKSLGISTNLWLYPNVSHI